MKKIFLVLAYGYKGLPNYKSILRPQEEKIFLKIPEAIALETDIALLGILGYDVFSVYTGAGPMDCLAAQIALPENTIALRAAFVSLAGDEKTIQKRFADSDIPPQDLAALCFEINAKISLSNATFEFVPTSGAAAVLVISGMHSKVSAMITNTDPAYLRQGFLPALAVGYEDRLQQALPILVDSKEAREAAALVNEFTQKAGAVLLESGINKQRQSSNLLPINAILCHGAGERIAAVPALSKLYGMRFACFLERPMERAISVLSGMEVIQRPQASGHSDVDAAVAAKISLDALQKYDGVVVQLKNKFSDDDAFALGGRDAFFHAIAREIDFSQTLVAIAVVGDIYAKEIPVLILGANIPPELTQASMRIDQFLPQLLRFAYRPAGPYADPQTVPNEKIFFFIYRR